MDELSSIWQWLTNALESQWLTNLLLILIFYKFSNLAGTIDWRLSIIAEHYIDLKYPTNRLWKHAGHS